LWKSEVSLYYNAQCGGAVNAFCWREYKVLCCVLFMLKVVYHKLSDMFAISKPLVTHVL